MSSDLPTTPGSVIAAKPPGRKKTFLMALDTDGWWRRLDGPFTERGPFRDVTVMFDASPPELDATFAEAETNWDNRSKPFSLRHENPDLAKRAFIVGYLAAKGVR